MTYNVFGGTLNLAVSIYVNCCQDIMSPPVIMLNTESFDALVRHKSAKEIWVVDFYAPWCGPCQQLSPEWRRLAKVVLTNRYIKVIIVVVLVLISDN